MDTPTLLPDREATFSAVSGSFGGFAARAAAPASA